MDRFDYPAECPILKRKIDMDTCFDIHMVVCGEAPKWTVPQEVFESGNFIKICNSCEYHKDV